jgi:TPR repeat protein
MTNFIKTLSLSLLMGSTFITHAMDEMTIHQSQNPKDGSSIILKKENVKREYGLTNTLDLFEARQWKEAYKSFKRMSEAGGIVGSAYMAYMEEKGYVDPSILHDHFVVESIPEVGQDLSRSYLRASLAYMEPEMETKVKQLAPLVINQNAHAVSLMYKLCTKDPSAFSSLLKIKLFKKYRSTEDLFKNFRSDTKPIICWNCLDPNYFVYLHKNIQTSPVAKLFTLTELQYFAKNYEKKPQLLGKLAHKLATTNDSTQVKQPLFWAHLALENGLGNLCGQLGQSLYDLSRAVKVSSVQHRKFQNRQSTTNVPLSSEQRNYLELSRHYAYHLQKGDLLNSEKAFQLIAHYGGAYEHGTYGNPDMWKSFLFDQKAADLGSSASQYDVAVKLRDGKRLEKDSRKALHYFKLAAAQNNTDAQFNLAVMYFYGDGIETDIEEAFHYCKLAEGNGDLDAKDLHVKLLSKAKTDLESLKTYANQGNLDAQIKCANWLYEKGNNSQKSQESNGYFSESRHYFDLAAAQNNKHALYNYAFMLYCGIGGVEDLPKARENYKRAADQGMVLAQHNYAVMMYLGEGGDQDSKVAEEYCQKAANQGFIDAIIALKSIKEEVSQVLDEDVEIILPILQTDDEDDSTPEEVLDPVSFASASQEKSPEEFPSFEIKSIHPLKTKEQEEIQLLLEKHQQEISELRTKKQAQKRFAELSKQTLKMKREDYEKSKRFTVKRTQTTTKKSNVAYGTLEFVKTIFGMGDQKINAFSIQAARQAFADLGCEVSNKKGENSTKLKFNLDGGRVMKFKFHNPHGQGNDLYDALKPYMRRFLESINKTPDTLRS